MEIIKLNPEGKDRVNFKPDTIYEVDLTDTIQFGMLKGDVINSIFKDGRIAGLISEHFIVEMFTDLQRADSEKSPYDVYHTKWMHGYEMRTVTKGGVSYCPSYMIGKGRKYCAEEHHEKIDNIFGFILFDITQMPIVKILSVTHNHPKHDVLYKQRQGYLAFSKTFYE